MTTMVFSLFPETGWHPEDVNINMEKSRKWFFQNKREMGQNSVIELPNIDSGWSWCARYWFGWLMMRALVIFSRTSKHIGRHSRPALGSNLLACLVKGFADVSVLCNVWQRFLEFVDPFGESSKFGLENKLWKQIIAFIVILCEFVFWQFRHIVILRFGWVVSQLYFRPEILGLNL